MIVTTKKCYRIIDTKRAAKEAISFYALHATNRSSYYNKIPHGTYQSYQEYQQHVLASAIEHGISKVDTPECYHPINVQGSLDRYESSTEIKGFEDVRLKVEEILKEEYRQELEGKIAEAKAAKEKYEQKYADAKRDALEEVQQANQLEIDTLRAELKTCDTQTQLLQDALNEKEEAYQKLLTEKNVLQATNDKVEKYKNAANKSEEDNIMLKAHIRDLEREISVLNKKIATQDKPWYTEEDEDCEMFMPQLVYNDGVKISSTGAFYTWKDLLTGCTWQDGHHLGFYI